jgi:hypothetical protein
MSTLSPLDQFLQECHAVHSGRISEIPKLRQRAKTTGPSLENMRLAAQAADVEIIKDGKELKAVRASYLPPLEVKPAAPAAPVVDTTKPAPTYDELRDVLRVLLDHTCRPPSDAGKMYDRARELSRLADAHSVQVNTDSGTARTHVCIEVTVSNEYPVKVEQFANKRFRVSYGLDVKGKTAADGLGYGKACAAFGQGVFHALACAGMLDNNGPD